ALNVGFANYFPRYLVNVSGTLFFNADNGTGRELWKSDGTADGTVLVKDINPAGDSNPVLLTAADGDVFFRATDGVTGQELWKSDGTADGTILVADINPSSGSYPSGLTDAGGRLFFAADDGTHGSEPWALDFPDRLPVASL